MLRWLCRVGCHAWNYTEKELFITLFMGCIGGIPLSFDFNMLACFWRASYSVIEAGYIGDMLELHELHLDTRPLHLSDYFFDIELHPVTKEYTLLFAYLF
jgi:hypothetical protein